MTGDGLPYVTYNISRLLDRSLIDLMKFRILKRKQTRSSTVVSLQTSSRNALELLIASTFWSIMSMGDVSDEGLDELRY